LFFSTLPTQGGFTNFQNANVHVRPNAGAAVFFSYIDPATNITDNGLTQHSGCPVYEGEKKIITQWVRYGVSKETPHSAFNTCKYRLFDRNRHFCFSDGISPKDDFDPIYYVLQFFFSTFSGYAKVRSRGISA